MADCDVSIQYAMKWSAFLVGICQVFMIHALSMKFTKGDSMASCLAIPLWFFSGGLGFLEVLDYGLCQNSDSNYIHDLLKNRHLFWFQSLTHIFHPQRSATFAMPLCYITIYALLEGTDTFNWKFFALAGIIVGITPQTQAHAFVSLAIFAIVLSVVCFPFSESGLYGKAIKCWVIFGVIANVIAFPLWIPFVSRASENSEFFDIRPNWNMESYVDCSNPLRFFVLWWRSLGVFGVVALFFGWTTADWSQIRQYFASMGVFFVASVVMFQPWELDNCKVYQDGWMPLALGFVGQYFSKLLSLSKSVIMKLVLFLLLITCCCSGLLSLITYERWQIPFASIAELGAGQWVAENSPRMAIFHAKNSETMVPASCYGGRRLFEGYRGWVTSHGLNNRTRTLYSAYFDDGGREKEAREENIGYMILSASEEYSQKSWAVDAHHSWEPVFGFAQYRIWKMRDEEAPEPKNPRKDKWDARGKSQETEKEATDVVLDSVKARRERRFMKSVEKAKRGPSNLHVLVY
jgi:hypothetical protein